MREIKFRAWDKKEKIMRKELDFISWDNKEIGYPYIDPFGFNTNTCSFSQIELMQWTGWHDKEGKEIYEGDILRILYTDWPSQTDYNISHEDIEKISKIGFVQYNAPKFEINFGKDNKYNEDHFGEFNIGAHGIGPEIIGNIYENPELLSK